ncbi:MAG: tetratricopeptide repeat protein [Planctomycetes bacterium]|jgi:Flp pilus assembly protein TadD|nr:tetratricopeptide repeat protein [Planctomycetota bacterium]
MSPRSILQPLAGPISALLLLLLVTAAVYLPGLGNEFVFDDQPYLLENPLFERGLGLEAVRASFTRFHAGNWHPLTWLSHALDLSLFGRVPAGHRAVNIAMHLANVVLLWLLLRRLTGAAFASLFAAGLFALHPLNVESVAWVAERKNLLSTLFGLLAVHAYVSWAQRPSARLGLLVLLAFAGSLLAKSMLVTLPVLLVLLDGWPLGRLGRIGLRRALVEKWPLFALSFSFGVVAIFAQRAGTALAPLDQFPLWTRFTNAVMCAGRYLLLTIRPTGLAAFYPHPGRDVPWVDFVLALFFVLSATVAAIAVRRRWPWLLTGWLLYLVTLGPVIGILQVGNQAMADRYAYVPLIGVFLVLAAALARSPRRLVPPAAAGAVIVLGALGWLTFRQVGVWRDSFSLFRHAFTVTERNYLAHYNYAVALDLSGRKREALEHYRLTVKYRPEYHMAWTNLGLASCLAGRYDEAVPMFREAVRHRPEFAEGWFNLATALSDAGRIEEALPIFERGLSIRPRDGAALRNRGIAYLRLARFADAAESLATSASLAPSAATENDLGFALESLGRRDEAKQHYRRSIEMDPSPGNLARRGLARLSGR